MAAVVPALDGAERGLDPRLRTAWTLTAAAIGLAAGLAGAVVAIVADGPAWLALLLGAAGVVLAVAGAVGARLEWASYRYRVTDEAVEITHGVIVQTLSVLPHRRIQQIDVRRGPIERRLGLATLVLRSAAATTDATLPGLADAEAVELRAALLARAGLGRRRLMRAQPPFGAVPSRTSLRTVPYHLSSLAAAVAGLLVLSGGEMPGGGARIALISIALVAVGRVASWWRRTISFEHDRIVVDEGLLQRTQRVVPYERIQQVDLRSDIRHRVLAAASVRIDVAGGAGQGVRLDVLPERLARSLQAFVLARRDDELAAEGVPVPAAGEAGETLLVLSNRRLLLAGLMSDAVGVAFAGAAGLFGFVWQLGLVTPDDVADQASSETHVLAGIVALVLLTPVAAALAGVYRYGRYRLWVDGDRLHLAHGLVETRRITVPRRRVQVVTVRENIVGRRLGLVSIVVASATTAGDRSAPTVLRVPILPRAELDDFLVELMGDPAWRPPALAPRPRAALRRAVVRRTVPLLVVVGAVAFLTPWSVLAAPAAIALGVVWGRAAHRRAGHAATEHLSALAAGVVLHRLHLVPHARLQSARASSSPFQRRVTLATLHLDVAGRKDAPHLLDLDGPTAQRLALALPGQGVRV